MLFFGQVLRRRRLRLNHERRPNDPPYSDLSSKAVGPQAPNQVMHMLYRQDGVIGDQDAIPYFPQIFQPVQGSQGPIPPMAEPMTSCPPIASRFSNPTRSPNRALL